GVLIFAAARPIARLFVDDAAVVADTVSFIRVLAAFQPLMALDFTLGGALRGAGDTRFPLVAVFLGFYVCRLGFAWLVTFALGLGVGWLWLALVGDYLARSVLKGARFRSGVWKTVAVGGGAQGRTPGRGGAAPRRSRRGGDRRSRCGPCRRSDRLRRSARPRRRAATPSRRLRGGTTRRRRGSAR